MPTTQADPWHRSFWRNRDRSFDRQRSSLPQGTRVCSVDGAGAEAVLDRGKTKLYGISKRGNNYLRKILIHGARAVVLQSKRERIARGAWMTSLETRAPRNVLIGARVPPRGRPPHSIR